MNLGLLSNPMVREFLALKPKLGPTLGDLVPSIPDLSPIYFGTLKGVLNVLHTNGKMVEAILHRWDLFEDGHGERFYKCTTNGYWGKLYDEALHPINIRYVTPWLHKKISIDFERTRKEFSNNVYLLGDESGGKNSRGRVAPKDRKGKDDTGPLRKSARTSAHPGGAPDRSAAKPDRKSPQGGAGARRPRDAGKPARPK